MLAFGFVLVFNDAGDRTVPTLFPATTVNPLVVLFIAVFLMSKFEVPEIL